MDVGPSGQSARPVPRVERRPALPIGVYGPRGLALRCAIDGRDAGRSGEPVTVCPYLPDSRPLAAKWWVRGYIAGLRDAGLPTAADRIDEWDEDAPWPGDEREDSDEPSSPAETSPDASRGAERDAPGLNRWSITVAPTGTSVRATPAPTSIGSDGWR